MVVGPELEPRRVTSTFGIVDLSELTWAPKRDAMDVPVQVVTGEHGFMVWEEPVDRISTLSGR